MNRTWKGILFVIYCVLTIIFVVWAFATGVVRPIVILPAGDVKLVPEIQVFTLVPAIREQRELSLEFPSMIRVGDSDAVRLTFDIGDGGKIFPGASLPSVFATHNVMVEARLDLPGIDIRPGATISEPLRPGQKVTFYWSVLPVEAGIYKGTVWFYLRFIPLDGGEEKRIALSAQQITIEVTTLLGLDVNLARAVGIGGLLLGLFLFYPFFLKACMWVWKKIRPADQPITIGSVISLIEGVSVL